MMTQSIATDATALNRQAAADWYRYNRQRSRQPATAAPLLQRSLRNWFRPNYPYVYATFRCVTECVR
jgi:hypothetical protein